MNIISVDPGFRSMGLFFSEGGLEYSSGMGNPVGMAGMDRRRYYGFIAKEFNRYAKKNDLLIIENYAFGKTDRSVTILAEIGGIIRGMFSAQDKPIIEMPIPTWKSICGIKDLKYSKKNKKEYLAAINDRFDKSFL